MVEEYVKGELVRIKERIGELEFEHDLTPDECLIDDGYLMNQLMLLTLADLKFIGNKYHVSGSTKRPIAKGILKKQKELGKL